MRIVASMTTIPSRIDHIRPAIDAVLAQTTPVDHVEINIPQISIRQNAYYNIPRWMKEIDRLSIFRTKDYGPITKIAPTLLRYREDQETFLWSVDDDCAYGSNQLAMICRAHTPAKRRILSRYGGLLDAQGVYEPVWGEMDVSMIEGFGGVLYPPGCIGVDFEDYVEITSANADCRRNDDIVLSMYFARRSIGMYIYNHPSDEEPYMCSGWLPHASRDALSMKGHVDNYLRIHSFITSLHRSGAGPVPSSDGPANAEDERFVTPA